MLMPRYLRGKRSQAEVAAELGVSVRQLQRIEEEALLWWTLAVCRAIRREIGDLDSSTGDPGGGTIPCRISANRTEHREHAPRAPTSPPASSPGGVVRAGLPRRWSPPR
jgi:hypothetical protein